MKKKRIYIVTLFIILIVIGCSDNSVAPTEKIKEPEEPTPTSKIETFTLIRNDLARKGKIYLPASYETNKNLPAIYLIDFTEQHFKTATDEFAKVIDGVKQIEGFDALVITLENIPDIQAKTSSFQEYYNVFKNITSYVDSNYTNNTSRTFIARASEAGIVLQTLFLEKSETSLFENFIATDTDDRYNSAIMTIIQFDDFPKSKSNKKLHYSFSPSSQSASSKNMIKSINEAQYPWLQFESVEYKDLIFENAYPTAYTEGLKYVFNK